MAIELELRRRSLVDLRSSHGGGSCESYPTSLRTGECSEGPQIVEGGGKGWRTSELAFQHHRSEAPAGQAEPLAPALAQGGTQFLRRPLGGAMVARGGLRSKSARGQGRPVRGLCLCHWKEEAWSLFPRADPSCPSASLALSLGGGVTS